jgi:hypothetical protein
MHELAYTQRHIARHTHTAYGGSMRLRQQQAHGGTTVTCNTVHEPPQPHSVSSHFATAWCVRGAVCFALCPRQPPLRRCAGNRVAQCWLVRRRRGGPLVPSLVVPACAVQAVCSADATSQIARSNSSETVSIWKRSAAASPTSDTACVRVEHGHAAFGAERSGQDGGAGPTSRLHAYALWAYAPAAHS